MGKGHFSKAHASTPVMSSRNSFLTLKTLGLGSPRLPQTGLSLLCGSGKLQGLFTLVLLLMGCRGSSPTLMTSEPVLPRASGVDRGGISPLRCHQKVDVGRGQVSHIHIVWSAQLHPCQLGQFCWAAQTKCKACFPERASLKGSASFAS